MRETASKVTEDLQRRYDLLFLRLETPKPVRLTAALRWGISKLKIPAHAWKSPVPAQVIEDYLAEEPDGHLAPPILVDWVQVVNKFIPLCSYLDNATESEPGPRPRYKRPRAGSGASGASGASSGASPISEGHVSPDEDGPSRKVVRYYD